MVCSEDELIRELKEDIEDNGILLKLFDKNYRIIGLFKSCKNSIW